MADGHGGGVRVVGGFGALPVSDHQPVAAPGAFRLAIIGDFGGDGTGLPHSLTHDDLNALPGRLGVNIKAVVPNRLGSASPSIGVTIPIGTLRDLDPIAATGHVPEIAAAEAFLTHRDPRGATSAAIDKVTALVQRPISQPVGGILQPSAEDDDAISRLLSIVDTPTAPADGRQAVSALMSAVVGNKTSESRAFPDLPEARALIDAQRRDIVTHPAWIAVEAAWRGLKVLLSALDARMPVAIEIRDVRRGELAQQLPAILAESNETFAPGLGAAVVLGAFGSSPADLDQLDQLAAAAEMGGVPVMLSLSADFFGAEPQRVARMDHPGALLEGPAYNGWRGLRQRDESQWLTALWNDVLLREETNVAPALWGEPAIMAAALLLRSVARTGWPSEILGPDAAITGLEVATTDIGGGRTAASPLRALITYDAARSLAQSGVAALAARPDRDHVFLVSAPTLFDASHSGHANSDEAGRTTSLPYHLVTARFQQTLAGLLAGVTTFDPETLATRVEHLLRELLLSTGPGATADVQVIDEPAGAALHVSVHFGRNVLDGVGLDFQIPARR